MEGVKKVIVLAILLWACSAWGGDGVSGNTGELSYIYVGDNDTIKAPKYYCRYHGEIPFGWYQSIHIDEEFKILCPKCYEEFLDRNVTELEEVKE